MIELWPSSRPTDLPFTRVFFFVTCSGWLSCIEDGCLSSCCTQRRQLLGCSSRVPSEKWIVTIDFCWAKAATGLHAPTPRSKNLTSAAVQCQFCRSTWRILAALASFQFLQACWTRGSQLTFCRCAILGVRSTKENNVKLIKFSADQSVLCCFVTKVSRWPAARSSRWPLDSIWGEAKLSHLTTWHELLKKK